MKNDKWKKEFCKKFAVRTGYIRMEFDEPEKLNPTEMGDFIEKTLQEQREEIMRRAKVCTRGNCPEGCDICEDRK